jgi:hypothetical protein
MLSCLAFHIMDDKVSRYKTGCIENLAERCLVPRRSEAGRAFCHAAQEAKLLARPRRDGSSNTMARRTKAQLLIKPIPNVIAFTS